MTITTEQFDSHIGTWCQLADVSGLGVIATDEFQFLPDGTFIWFSFVVDGQREFLIRRAGTWKQMGELLTLQINQSSEPDMVPKERVDLKIFDREGRLGLEKCRQDEESRKNICSYFLKPDTAGVALQRLQAAQEKALAKRKLPLPFALLESMLVEAIPVVVQGLKLTKPIFCLRLYFYDTHAPEEGYGFRIRILTEPLRKGLQDKSPHVPNLVEDLWLPQSGAANGIANPKDGLYEATIQGNEEITRLFSEIYQRLCQSESENMPLLRQLARRVCKKLNAVKWDTYAPVTDDFVAFPADGSGFWGDEFEEDLIGSVPAERVKVLRKRGFLE